MHAINTRELFSLGTNLLRIGVFSMVLYYSELSSVCELLYANLHKHHRLQVSKWCRRHVKWALTLMASKWRIPKLTHILTRFFFAYQKSVNPMTMNGRSHGWIVFFFFLLNGACIWDLLVNYLHLGLRIFPISCAVGCEGLQFCWLKWTRHVELSILLRMTACKWMRGYTIPYMY